MQPLKGIKILLVDDEPNILQFLELGLQNEGFEVQCASNGLAAITLMKEFQPQVVARWKKDCLFIRPLRIR